MTRQIIRVKERDKERERGIGDRKINRKGIWEEKERTLNRVTQYRDWQIKRERKQSILYILYLLVFCFTCVLFLRHGENKE